MNLADLIEANRRGRTNSELMHDSGQVIDDRDYFRRLATMSSFPRVGKIHGLARALEVSPATVLAAAAEQLGLGQLQPGEDTEPALLGAQTRADRLQAELDNEREQVRRLTKRLSNLKSRPKPSGSRSTPADDDGETDYWRDHALRYRQRLARYEGLRPLPGRQHRRCTPSPLDKAG